MINIGNKIYWGVGAMLGVLVVILVGVAGLPGDKLLVWFLDVGQGDAALVESPVGERILIDGGPDSAVLREMGKVLPFYVSDLDLIILSHPHADHLNGLLEVLRRYKVKAVLMTGVKYGFGGYDEFYRLLGEKGVKIYFADGVSDFRLGKIGLDLVYPEHSLQGLTFDNVNNSSIVLRLIYGQRKMFFSGDLEMEKEAEVITEKNLQLGADLLKAGHHGSKTSNTAGFVARIKPAFAVISCGVNNKFNHPAAETVERFLKRGVTLFRTDLDGMVALETDGAGEFTVKATGK